VERLGWLLGGHARDDIQVPRLNYVGGTTSPVWSITQARMALALRGEKSIFSSSVPSARAMVVNLGDSPPPRRRTLRIAVIPS
jgi:hypothetical protein